jgi:hypothetical protein
MSRPARNRKASNNFPQNTGKEQLMETTFNLFAEAMVISLNTIFVILLL